MRQHETKLMSPFKCLIMSDFKVLSSSTELISVVNEAYFLFTQFGGKEKNEIKQPQRQVVSGLMCPLVYLSIITPRVHKSVPGHMSASLPVR